MSLQILKAKEDETGQGGGQRHREKVIAPSTLTTYYVVLPQTKKTQFKPYRKTPKLTHTNQTQSPQSHFFAPVS